MPPRPSKSDCSATSPPPGDLHDLNLPEVLPGEEPLPSPPATPEALFAHARLLLKNLPPDFWEKRQADKNPEPFVL